MELFFPICFFLCILVALAVILMPIRAEKRELAGVQNYDAFQEHILFQLPGSPEEAETLLAAENVLDEPRSRYDQAASILTFFYLGVEMRYRVSYLTDGVGTYLLLTRFSKLARGVYPY